MTVEAAVDTVRTEGDRTCVGRVSAAGAVSTGGTDESVHHEAVGVGAGGNSELDACVRHRQLGNVHVPLALWMLVGSAPLSLVGVQIASSFSDGTQSTMGRVVGGALIAGGIGFAIKTFMRGHIGDAPLHLTTRHKLIAIAIGASCGFVVGLTSVGSGTFFGLAMLLVYPLAARRIVGTDMLHASLLLWVAGAGHLLHGNVNLHAMLWLLVGSIPGVLIGSHLSVRVPERSLRIAFGFVLILSGIKLVGLPAVTLIIEISLALGMLALVTWLAVQFRQRRLPAHDAA